MHRTGIGRWIHTPTTMCAVTSASCAVVTFCHQIGRPLLYDRIMSTVGVHTRHAVPYGPRAFRYRIRRMGPFVGLVPAAILGLIALRLLYNNTATSRGIAGFAAAVLAAPGLLAVGIPLATGAGRLMAGIAASAALWFVVGFVAARRATRSPVAVWRDFWREFAWLAAGIWLGVGLALALIELFLGRALL